MSSEPYSVDPYRPPLEIAADPTSGRRPGGLTAICVLAIVLGALGLFTWLMGVAGLFGGKQMQQAFQMQNQPGMDDEMNQIMKDMQDDSFDLQARYFIPNAAVLGVHLLVAVLLLVGGLGTLGLKPNGRMILMGVCALAILLEAGRTVVYVSLQTQNMSVIDGHMQRMLTASPQGAKNKQMADIMKVTMRVALILTFVFYGIIELAKVSFYLASLIYLTRPKVKALFQPILTASLSSSGAP